MIFLTKTRLTSCCFFQMMIYKENEDSNEIFELLFMEIVNQEQTTKCH